MILILTIWIIIIFIGFGLLILSLLLYTYILSISNKFDLKKIVGFLIIPELVLTPLPPPLLTPPDLTGYKDKYLIKE